MVDQSQDEKAAESIKARLRTKSQDYYRRDLDAVMDVYLNSEDVCIFDPPIIYYGYAATRRMIKDFIDGAEGPMRIDYQSPEVRVSGDLACSWQVCRIETDLKSGAKVDVLCRMTDVWKRVNGKWYVIHEHNSIPMDTETANTMLSLGAGTMSDIAR